MIEYMDISNFVEWFIDKIIDIIGDILDLMNNIYIAENVSILDFIIAIIIIASFISIIVTIPSKINIREKRKEQK